MIIITCNLFPALVIEQYMEFKGSVRKTRQRETILETLVCVKSHPTADELFRMVREKLPHISLATVYRNLELMVEEGVVKKISSGEREMRFDGDVSRHYHMRCVACAKPYDLPFNPEISLNDLCPDAGSFGIFDVNVEFEFVCDKCKEDECKRNVVTNGPVDTGTGGVVIVPVGVVV